MTAPRPKRYWFLYWLIGFGLIAFGMPEAVALVDPDAGDSLTESLRYVTGTPLGKAGFVAFIGWFVWHILIQRPRRKE